MKIDASNHGSWVFLLPSEEERAMFFLLAVRALQMLYPSLKGWVIAEAHLESLLKQVHWLPNRFVLSKNGRLRSLGKKDAFSSWTPFQKLKIHFWDVGVNFSKSENMMRLFSKMNCDFREGFVFKNHKKVVEGKWGQFFWIERCFPNALHLSDLYSAALFTLFQKRWGEGKNTNIYFPLLGRDFFSLQEKRVRKTVPPLFIDLESFACGDFEKWISWMEEIKEMLKDIPWVSLVSRFWYQKAKQSVSVSLKRKPTNVSKWISLLKNSLGYMGDDLKGATLASLFNLPSGLFAFQKRSFFHLAPYGSKRFFIVAHHKQAPDFMHPIFKTFLETFFEKTFSSISFFPMRKDNFLLFQSRLRSLEEGGGLIWEQRGSFCFCFSNWEKIVLESLLRRWLCHWKKNLLSEIPFFNLDLNFLSELRSFQKDLFILKKTVRCFLKFFQKNFSFTYVSDAKKLLCIPSDRWNQWVMRKVFLEKMLLRYQKKSCLFHLFQKWITIPRNFSQGSAIEEMKGYYKVLLDVWEGIYMIDKYLKGTFQKSRLRLVDVHEDKKEFTLNEKRPSLL